MRVSDIINETLEENWKKKTAALAAAGVLAGFPIGKHLSDRSAVPQVSTQEDPSEDAFSPKFMKKLRQISDELSINSNDLLRVMYLETIGTYNPSITNAIGATGLIQFMPHIARALGTSTDALKKMTATQQLDYVYKYYELNKLPPNSSASDIYLMTFMPVVVRQKKPDNFVLGARGAYRTKVFPNIVGSRLSRGSVWDQNPVFHEDPQIKRRGFFTVGDVRAAFEKKTQKFMPPVKDQSVISKNY